MKEYFNKTTSAAPLAVFRILFGMLMLFSVVRFWYNGWIELTYIQPKYYFPFYGFEFVRPLGSYIYLLFIVCGISALLVAIGCYYRIAIVTLFLSFTYIELIDKTTYLNHYYFVSMVCLILIFMPAHVYFSVDAYKDNRILADDIPQWCIDVIKLFVTILYVYAGLAKINGDWLLEALPLGIWLPSKNDLSIIGTLFNYPWVHYAFSWFGCIYDLSIPFLLWFAKTRPWAYVAVVVFHLFTSLLFPIGVFPYVMIATALIFFSKTFHLKVIELLSQLFRLSPSFVYPRKRFYYAKAAFLVTKVVLWIFFILQILLPLRYLCYPGNLFWTEQGFRFSWRVMLMEKAGYAQFHIKDNHGKKLLVDNSQFLTPLQEKMMATQPDMILQYAHLLRDHFTSLGFIDPEVYVDSYVVLNGRSGRSMIDPKINLAKEKESFGHKSWIILYND